MIHRRLAESESVVAVETTLVVTSDGFLASNLRVRVRSGFVGWRRCSRGRSRTVLEDVILRAVQEVVQIVVKGWAVLTFEHVVLLFLVPVKGLFSTDRAVGRSCSPDTGFISTSVR